MKTSIDQNGEVFLHRPREAARGHAWLFWGCVGVSLVVVVIAWVVTIRGVIQGGVEGAKTTFTGAAQRFQTMKTATEPIRAQVGEAGAGVQAVVAEAFADAQQRQEALGVVADIVQNELSDEPAASAQAAEEPEPVSEEPYVEEPEEAIEPAI